MGVRSGPKNFDRLLIRGDSSDALADHQGVDVVGAFVGFDRFEVAHVAHDGVFVDDAAIAAAYTACQLFRVVLRLQETSR